MNESRDVIPLSPENVSAYLERRGVLRKQSGATVRAFPGGVSAVTLLVSAPGQRVVVKQALPRLRVDRAWYSDPRRAVVEARALQQYAQITPEATPTLLDVDPELCAFTMTAAPEGTVTWKEQLLAGHVDPGSAVTVGTILGRWHAATTEPRIRAGFTDRTWFDELRVEPFYGTVMAARPDLADAMAGHLHRMLREQRVLVHGDFSPKNVLVMPDHGIWVVDFEVAHAGDPTFDLAFLLHHLLLKAVHLPSRSSSLLAAARSALTGYRAVRGTPEISGDHLNAHIGCLTLARVLGTSPATYLSAEERATAEAIGAALVEAPSADLDDSWPKDHLPT